MAAKLDGFSDRQARSLQTIVGVLERAIEELRAPDRVLDRRGVTTPIRPRPGDVVRATANDVVVLPHPRSAKGRDPVVVLVEGQPVRVLAESSTVNDAAEVTTTSLGAQTWYSTGTEWWGSAVGGSGGAGGGATGAAGREYEITIATDTTWSDFDLAAAAPGISAGDVVALVLEANLTVDSIIPPDVDGFWCWIGIRDLTAGDFTVRFVDRLNGSGGTSAYRFRTPGTISPDTHANDLVLRGEEAWTGIGYTSISENWRIFENRTMDIVWVEAPMDPSGSAAANALALQNLIDGGYKYIQMPAGTFTVNSVDLASYVHLRGAGMDQTTLTWASQNFTTDPGSQGVLNLHGSSGDPIVYVTLEDFTVDGNKSGVTVSGSGNSLDLECISHTFADHCYAKRVRCINAEGDGFDYDDCRRCVTEDCFGEDCDGFGLHNSLRTVQGRHLRFTAIDCGAVHLRGGMDTHGTSPNEATDCVFTDCTATGCYRGILLGGHRNVAKGCRVDSCTNTGIRVAGEENVVDACIVTSTAGNNITIDGAVVGDRNTISNCQSHRATNSGNGIILTAGCIRNVLNGNHCYSNAGNGIVLQNTATNPDRTIITSNIVLNNTAGQIVTTGSTNTTNANNIVA